MEPIEVLIGEIQAELHEQFADEAGEEYRERIRRAVENEINAVYRQQERMREQIELEDAGADDGVGADAGE